MKVPLDNRFFGIIQASIGEALGGFAAGSVPLSEKSRAEALRARLEQDEVVILSDDEADIALVALQFALKELGPEEFSTITGYDFDFGVTTAQALQDSCAAHHESEK